MLKYITYTVLLSLFLFSCKKDDDVINNTNNSKVYVAGIKGLGTVGVLPKAFYRINDFETVLDSMNSFQDFFVSDAGDVYIVGSKYTVGNPIKKAIAYKNGQRITLSGLNNSAGIENIATSVFVDNNDVYILGVEGTFSGLQALSLRVWKNGQLLNSYNPSNNKLGAWTKIHVYNNDVYICGNAYNGSLSNGGYFATVLKNGTELNRYFSTGTGYNENTHFAMDKMGNWYLAAQNKNDNFNTYLVTNGVSKNINRQPYNTVTALKLFNNKPVIAQYDDINPKHSYLIEDGFRVFDFNTAENRNKYINDFHIDDNNFYTVGDVITNIPNSFKSFYYKNGNITIKDNESIQKIIVK